MIVQLRNTSLLSDSIKIFALKYILFLLFLLFTNSSTKQDLEILTKYLQNEVFQLF